jgi:hypothetical protein
MRVRYVAEHTAASDAVRIFFCGQQPSLLWHRPAGLTARSPAQSVRRYNTRDTTT